VEKAQHCRVGFGWMTGAVPPCPFMCQFVLTGTSAWDPKIEIKSHGFFKKKRKEKRSS
jgi:hypothetical protein